MREIKSYPIVGKLINMFDNWLSRPGGSPADVALKTKLKKLLGGGEGSIH